MKKKPTEDIYFTNNSKRCGWCNRHVHQTLMMARLADGTEVCLCCLNSKVHPIKRGLK